MLPYITKFKCPNCDKFHRLGFMQWWNAVNHISDYLMVQRIGSKNTEIALARTLSKFKMDLKNVGLINKLRYKIGKWFLDL